MCSLVLKITSIKSYIFVDISKYIIIEIVVKATFFGDRALVQNDKYYQSRWSIRNLYI